MRPTRRALPLLLLAATACGGPAGPTGATGPTGPAGTRGMDGTPGGDGASGRSTLVRVDEEGPGANCPAGGAAIRTGADDDGDGVLGELEVDATSYVCSRGPAPCDVVDGNIEVRTTLDVRALAGCRVIRGDLSIDAPSVSTAALAALEVVEGTLRLRAAGDWDGLARLTHVGGLVLGPQLVEPSGLVGLVAIAGDLVVEEGALRGFGGLERLAEIGGSLHVPSASGLDSLTALAALERLGGDLHLGATALTSLRGLEGLTRLDGALLLHDAPLLADLGALSNVVPDDARAHSISLANLPALATLHGLEWLRASSGLSIVGAPLLAEAGALSGLTRLEGELRLAQVPGLASLDFLANALGAGYLPSVDLSEAGLTDLRGLEGLTGVGTLRLQAAGVRSLAGLENLTAVGGELTLSTNGLLADVAALARLGEVTGPVTITDNAALADLDGLAGLTRVAGTLDVSRNAGLVRVELPALAAVDGDLLVRANGALATLGLPALGAVAGSFAVFGAPFGPELPTVIDASALRTVGSAPDTGHLTLARVGITSMAGFASLESVAGTLGLSKTSSLVGVDGLAHLVSAGSLELAYNAALTDLSGLSNLAVLTYAEAIPPYVGNNARLAQAQVDALFARLQLSCAAGSCCNNDGPACPL